MRLENEGFDFRLRQSRQDRDKLSNQRRRSRVTVRAVYNVCVCVRVTGEVRISV